MVWADEVRCAGAAVRLRTQGWANPNLPIETQMRQHDNFDAFQARVKTAPPYARYFVSLAATALGRNPHMSPADKEEIMNSLIDRLLDAIAATSAENEAERA
jgi:hypothetical protein